jgi:hypothetical protein
LQGAHLASVHSIKENDFIMAELSNTYSTVAYIGLSSLRVDEGYEWVDGTPAEFFNWFYNEPNNFEDMESCVTLDSKDG